MATESRNYAQEWGVREAFNAEALHKNGSYFNALLIKFDNVVTNLLSDILNAVDRYHNLHLLQSEVQAIPLLWVKIFEDTQMILDLINHLDNIAIFVPFKCYFPFFWLFVNSIENHRKIFAISSKYYFCPIATYISTCSYVT